jgi:hypothetical protein
MIIVVSEAIGFFFSLQSIFVLTPSKSNILINLFSQQEQSNVSTKNAKTKFSFSINKIEQKRKRVYLHKTTQEICRTVCISGAI